MAVPAELSAGPVPPAGPAATTPHPDPHPAEAAIVETIIEAIVELAARRGDLERLLAAIGPRRRCCGRGARHIDALKILRARRDQHRREARRLRSALETAVADAYDDAVRVVRGGRP